jgi:hypothetical protein
MKIENELIQFNSTSAEKLFEIYQALNFIYPAKMEHLQPIIHTVKENWEKAMKLDFPLFWVSTIKQNPDNIISSGTAWQYLNNGMIAQHLCSNQPIGSRMIFLGMLSKIIDNQHTGYIDSYQIYYQPQNKYSSKVFETHGLKAGKELSGIIHYNYLELPFLKIDCSGNIQLTEINSGINSDFIRFVTEQRGELFLKVQELNSEDINLKKLNNRFKSQGLKRTRRIFAAGVPGSPEIYGVIIINESSLGFNFSFFENSCELILCKNSDAQFLLQIAHKLLFRASEINALSPLEFIPVLTDPIHCMVMAELNGKVTRNYNLFIMLKGGYERYYEEVEELTNSIFQRFTKKSYEKN